MRPTGTSRARIMSDVAARAGVSHQTVSRVINGHPNVAPRTRARVELAIAELGYRPNIAARALVTGSTRTIGLVAMHLDQYGPAQTLIGLEKAAREAGYSLSVAILDHATAGEMGDAVDRFVAQKVDAVVALSTYDAAEEALVSLDPPVPLVTVQVGQDASRPSVGVDQEAGARLATRHLLDLGHRTVHHIAGPDGLAGGPGPGGRMACGARRRRRPGTGVRVRGLDARLRVRGGRAARLPDLRRRARERRLRRQRPDDPRPARGAEPAGLAVPDEISVVGFDDLPEAPYFTPTVDHRAAGLRRAGSPGRAAPARAAGGRRAAPRSGPGHSCRAVQHRAGEAAGTSRRRDLPAAHQAAARAAVMIEDVARTVHFAQSGIDFPYALPERLRTALRRRPMRRIFLW